MSLIKCNLNFGNMRYGKKSQTVDNKLINSKIVYTNINYTSTSKNNFYRTRGRKNNQSISCHTILFLCILTLI